MVVPDHPRALYEQHNQLSCYCKDAENRVTTGRSGGPPGRASEGCVLCWREPVWNARPNGRAWIEQLMEQWTRKTSGRRAQGGCLGDGGRGRTRPRGEMSGGGAGSLRSRRIRMGQPGGRTAHHPGQPGREPREVKHLSTARRREDSPSSGERTGRSPNLHGVRADWRCRVRVGRA